MHTSAHPFSGEELMAYLDGELFGTRAQAVSDHLQSCAECRKVMADLQSVSDRMAKWTVEKPEIAMPVIPLTRSFRRNAFALRPAWMLAPVGVAVALAILFVPRTRHEFSAPPSTAHRQMWPAVERSMSPFTVANKSFEGGVIGGSATPEAQAPAPPPSAVVRAGDVTGPKIVRTVDLRISIRALGAARDAVQRLVAAHSGYVADLTISSSAGQPRTFQATLRVPASQLDSLLRQLRGLGQVLYESQHAEDVTKQYVDLNARLNNARNTEQRLTELLRNRTGKLSDVLAVEEQIDTVRGQIEGMEAEMKNLSKQVDFSSVALTVTEEYDVPLSQTGNPPISTRLRNAAVEGYHNLVGAMVALGSWTLAAGPVLLFIAALLFLPARLIWRKMRVRV